MRLDNQASSISGRAARPAPNALHRTPASDAPGADPLVSMHAAGKAFGQKWVIRGLDLSVEHGTIFGLFGPSGSGKTTIIRLLLGLLAPDEGEVRVLGASPLHFRARTRARIGYMPQLFVLYPELTVAQNLDLAASLYGLGLTARGEPVREVLEFVELQEHRGKRADELSGGMQRRLELAAALVHDPEFVVADEPTAGVDPILRAKFWDHFRGLRDRGRTIFITSQYVSEAEYCDRVAILTDGRLLTAGPPEEIRRQAMGGEIVDVLVGDVDRATIQRLEALPEVSRVRVLSYEQLHLTVEDAGSAIPRLTAVLAEHGNAAKQIEPYHPSFDEVFVHLVERSEGDGER